MILNKIFYFILFVIGQKEKYISKEWKRGYWLGYNDARLGRKFCFPKGPANGGYAEGYRYASTSEACLVTKYSPKVQIYR